MEILKKIFEGVKKNSAISYILVLASICLTGFFCIRPLILSHFPTMSVSAAKKALPIYCVNRNDNKIAISFDAAWGAGR